MNQNDIAFWSMVGNWFAGWATFLAVIVSLYFSTRQTRIKLKCSFREGNGILSDGTNLGKYIFINITNLSLVPINIEHQFGVGMITKKIRLRFWKRKQIFTLIISPDNVSGSKNKLLSGETCSIWINFDNNNNNNKDKWYINMAKKLYTNGIKPNEIEAYIYVNNSKKYRFSFDPVVRKNLELAYKHIKNNS